MHKIQSFFENQAFGVCTSLGEKLGISICSIRLFFIYSSLQTKETKKKEKKNLQLLSNVWFTNYCVSVAGFCYKYAQTSAP
jgi:hypothetical protein